VYSNTSYSYRADGVKIKNYTILLQEETGQILSEPLNTLTVFSMTTSSLALTALLV